jgi:hypothetical protein
MRLGHYNRDGQSHYNPYTDSSTPQCECWYINSMGFKGQCTNHIGNNPARCGDGVARCQRHSRLVSPAVLARRSRLPGEQRYFGRPLQDIDSHCS